MKGEKCETRLLRVVDVADMLGVSTRQIWRLVQESVLPKPLKLGGGARWIEAEINASIEHLARARS